MADRCGVVQPVSIHQKNRKEEKKKVEKRKLGLGLQLFDLASIPDT
jgi:hypothetical protein